MRFLIDTITSKSYWKYILLSRSGAASILAIFGAFWLIIEILDFFKIYTRDQYASYAFLIFLGLSLLVYILIRRPIKSICIEFPEQDYSIEVRIEDLFDVSGAIMISTNTMFEADVAGGKIAPNSLQGQFTARYFTGSQDELITQVRGGLENISGSPPYPFGTTIPINTHGKTFYFTAMAELNEEGNARTTEESVKTALDGLWQFVREAGELQELAVPIIGTGRGRLALSRKKVIAIIAESFVRSSRQEKFTDRLVIVVKPEDSSRFSVNLYDIKDKLLQILKS